MSDYLVRGKRQDEKDWVEGYYCKLGPCGQELPHIIPTYASAFYGIEIDPSTVGQYTGTQIPERQVTDKNAYLKMKRVWQDDLIAIYSIGYDGDDNPARTHVATVRVQFDDNYKMLFAECVKGSMRDIAYECNINYLEDEDYPFTYWLEYMENGSGQFWEWEIIGNIHDNPELIGGGAVMEGDSHEQKS